MHSQAQELQRYLNEELGQAEQAQVEKHLAECSTCRTRLSELQAEAEALSHILQSWVLPAALNQLDEPLSLPARAARPPLNPGFISWASGVAIMVLFVLARAVFLLNSQLNWLADLVRLVGLNEWTGPLPLGLGNEFWLRPFYLAYLGELGEGIGLILTLLLPTLLYVISLGVLAILFFNWFSLTFANRLNRIRS